MTYTNPYIKVTWEDYSENFTHEKIKRVKSYFQNKYNTKNIKIDTISINADGNTVLKSIELNNNITDTNYQKSLMKDFIKENAIDVDLDKLNRLDNKVNEKILLTNNQKVKHNKWYLQKIEFSNFLSYGKFNSINLQELGGITVIESTPKNFGGKTTLTCDLFLFLFFNTTTKSKTNIEVFNAFTEDDELFVKGYIKIDDDDYVIERKLTRKTKKSGGYDVVNKLEFYKYNKDGSIINLSGEQRKETEQIITSAIGNQEDFLSTILTTGYNLEELIESKPTARGQILTKFMGLDNLAVKEQASKELFDEWKKKLYSNIHNINDLNADLIKLTESNKTLSDEIKKLKKTLKLNSEQLILENNKKENLLLKRNNNIDEELIKINVGTIEKEIEQLTKKKNLYETQILSIDIVEPLEYYDEKIYENHQQKYNKILLDKSINEKEISDKTKYIIDLQNGSVCPTCNRKLDYVDNSVEIEKCNKDIEKLKNLNYELLLQNQMAELKKLKDLKTQFDNYEKNKLIKVKLELEYEQLKTIIKYKNEKIENYNKNKKYLDENKQIDIDLINCKTKINSLQAEINTINNIIQKNDLLINTNNDKIKTNNEIINKIKQEEDTIKIFKTYNLVFGKNGISKSIMRNMIPLINYELHKLLRDSCEFTIEVNINEKNELEFIMIDTLTRVVKPLSSGSGYEKTIASLGLRSVLTKISSLPKPNIVIMDEVFGKIADENLDMVGEFFKKIKNYFEHIFVISHNPLIRNWSDNLISIKKIDNVSAIDYVKTNIS